MNYTGIVRKLDNLGRVVIPQDVRKQLQLQASDPLEITCDDDKIILRKYTTAMEDIQNLIDKFVLIGKDVNIYFKAVIGNPTEEYPFVYTIKSLNKVVKYGSPDSLLRYMFEHELKFIDDKYTKILKPDTSTICSTWEINCDGYYPYCNRCKVEPKNDILTNYCPNCGAKMDMSEWSQWGH